MQFWFGLAKGFLAYSVFNFIAIPFKGFLAINYTHLLYKNSSK